MDETPEPGETAQALVARLSLAKALKVAGSIQDSLVIGSDQAALLDGTILSKPGDHAAATAQLRAVSGHCVRFLTGVCLVNSSTGNRQTDSIATEVYFRDLSDAEIESYLRREQPYDCAGSFKSEQLGITLVTKIVGDDPSALIGLPLIRLCEMLANEGVKLL